MLYEEYGRYKNTVLHNESNKISCIQPDSIFFLREREKERGGKDTHNYYVEKKLYNNRSCKSKDIKCNVAKISMVEFRAIIMQLP